ncbi:hypothetical protein RRG08_014787 [Elysia crispata]|uniref:Uncharacterized protein n=1 Tax=Elysia crispata TaxID=231223 RepID=A0AAE1AVN4_9GAST|nr:hypothetical protein RRG08_014787 [Elysia crispata]
MPAPTILHLELKLRTRSSQRNSTLIRIALSLLQDCSGTLPASRTRNKRKLRVGMFQGRPGRLAAVWTWLKRFRLNTDSEFIQVYPIIKPSVINTCTLITCTLHHFMLTPSEIKLGTAQSIIDGLHPEKNSQADAQ